MAVAISAAVLSQLDAISQQLIISGRHPSRRIESVGPAIDEVALPSFPGASAIWGSTGQDSRGHIWIGVTAGGVRQPSAHLIEYDPEANRSFDRGNVVDQLRLAGILHGGEQQAKIHSRIVEGPDGYIYFASMDEDGEAENGSRLPTWGGHLWRLKLTTSRWEHLLAVPEALIAVGAGGRFVYALGYYGHVLFQYDTQTADIKRVPVGSMAGHVSRNFIVDARGHAYVPRVAPERTALGRQITRVSIVEYDRNLQEIKETRIDPEHYLYNGSLTESHGITGLQSMSDGSWFFTTHVGFLFHIVPPASASGTESNDGPAEVVSVSWFHPSGKTYVASLFTSDGINTLLGLSHDNLVEGAVAGYQWLTCDVKGLSCRVAPFDVSTAGTTNAIASGLLYGSATRDAHGNHYVVGVVPGSGGNRPVVLRVRPRAS